MQLLLAALLLLAACADAVNDERISGRVLQLLSRTRSRSTESHENVNLWVYFYDKGSLPSSYPQLHPRAAWRRGKVQGDIFDDDDFPVYSEYIEGVRALGVKIRRESKWLNAISVSIEPERSELVVNRIAELSFVSLIDVVERYTRRLPQPTSEPVVSSSLHDKRDSSPISYGPSFAQLNLMNVPELHAQGYNGTGVIVAIFDTGFMKEHPCLRSLTIIAEYDYLDNDNDTESFPPDIQLLHGTSTLSNLGGWDPGNLIGSGFGASFILAKTENVSVEILSEEDNFIAALEWVESLGADVVSASLGYNKWYTYYQKDGTTIPVSIAVDKAVAKGMVVVVSAGNYGNLGISAPADSFNVVSVGSVASDSTWSTWSSVGPTADGRVKPEVAARGDKNYVANAYTVPNNSHGTGNYTTNSGTSFACPLVAGVAAIILQAHPDWTPSMVKEALLMTASNYYAPNLETGWGIVQANDAVLFSPLSGNCVANGCSDLGCCSNGACSCAPEAYGPICNFSRVPCDEFCGELTAGQGQCLVQPATSYSFRCGSPTGPTIDNATIPQCPGCPLDKCGVCFGNNYSCSAECLYSESTHCVPTSTTASVINSGSKNGPDKATVAVAVLAGLVGVALFSVIGVLVV